MVMQKLHQEDIFLAKSNYHLLILVTLRLVVVVENRNTIQLHTLLPMKTFTI